MNSPPAEDTSPYTTDSDVPLESAPSGSQQTRGASGAEMNYLSSRLPAGGKRRMGGAPGSSVGGSGRDLKTRRREDTRKLGAGGAGAGGGSVAGREWVESEKGAGRTRDYKDELLDGPLIDQLRASIGDPFDETMLDKN